MRYVICHGALAPSSGTFDSSPSRVGFYVRHIGELLPQSDAVPIILQSKAPTLQAPPARCPNLVLSPLAAHEIGDLTQALGNSFNRPDIHFLDAPTTLAQLVVALGEDELRMIACTASQNAPRQVVREEVLPGIVVEHHPPSASQSQEKIGLDHVVRQVIFKRQKSAAQVAEYLDSLGEQTGPLWLVNDTISALMAEWAIGKLPPITGDPASWVETIFRAGEKPGRLALYKSSGNGKFPEFGKQILARIQQMHDLLATWPDCGLQLVQIFCNNDQGKEWLRYYFAALGGGDAAGQNVQAFLQRILPVQKLAEAVAPGNLDTWDAYLRAVQQLGEADLAVLRAVVDVDGYLPWMAELAAAWSDFNTLWAMVKSTYPNTIGTALQRTAAFNDDLRARIEAADRELDNAAYWGTTGHPAVMTHPGGTVYADGMDFAPSSQMTDSGFTEFSQGHLHCLACGSSQVFSKVAESDLAAAESRSQGVRLCPGCQAVVGSFDQQLAYACASCEGVRFVHKACLDAALT